MKNNQSGTMKKGHFLLFAVHCPLLILLAACSNGGDLDAWRDRIREANSGSASKVPVITIGMQPAATTSVTVGSISASLSVSASVTQSATLSYQWHSNATNSSNGGTAISGATNASYTIPTTLAIGTYYYFCEVRATGGAASVRSSVAAVNVTAVPVPVITISTQPTAITNVTAGNISGSLSVSASVTLSAILSYQWYSNTTNSNSGGTAISGATNASYTIPTTLATGTYYYFCEARATGGAASVRSGVAAVVVQPSPFPVEMVLIPAGTYTRGSSDDSQDYGAIPPHQVTLSKGFSMGKYEVTQAQYQAVMGTNPSSFIGSPASGETQARRPVESVTWYDAVEFCNKLSALEGLAPAYTITNRSPSSGYPITSATVTANWDANGYRLPTEAEWEYACRAGTTTAWSFGSTDSQAADYAWYSSNSNSMTHEVGKKQPNVWGLHDMHGNVWEWCWDWHGDYSSAAQTDPRGAVSGTGRVRRGGGWVDDAQVLRSAYRVGSNPNVRYFILGFRLVRP